MSSTIVIWLVVTVAAALPSVPLAVRIASSILSGLLMVRLFVIFHDYQHGAILRESRLAGFLMACFGLFTLSPASVWRRSHDHHHKHNSKTYGANVGSYPIMTTANYAESSSTERFAYRASRHPLTILFGYVTIFGFGMCVRPLIYNFRQHLDALLALILHGLLLVWLASIRFDVMLLGMFVPAWIASMLGAYLFYAQHNFPTAKYKSRDEWTRVEAALHSSSYIPMGAFMSWMTGNIGYHHVHHLNHKIPFYRLPAAMRAIPELQQPGTTTLTFAGIRECLRLKLWSPEHERMVGLDGS